MKYLIGFIVIAVGAFMVIKTSAIVNSFGRIEWAEQHLGTEGGTRVFYKILGVIFIIFAFLAMTGALNGMLRGMFGGAFRDNSQVQQQDPTYGQ